MRRRRTPRPLTFTRASYVGWDASRRLCRGGDFQTDFGIVLMNRCGGRQSCSEMRGHNGQNGSKRSKFKLVQRPQKGPKKGLKQNKKVCGVHLLRSPSPGWSLGRCWTGTLLESDGRTWLFTIEADLWLSSKKKLKNTLSKKETKSAFQN